MKNKRGSAVGSLVLFAIMVVVALSLAPQIFSSQAQMTNTFLVSNHTVTLNNAGTYTYLTYQELIDDTTTLVIYNATDPASVGANLLIVNPANFTIDEAINPSTNVKQVRITPVGKSTYNSSSVNITANFGLQGYADDGGSRAVAGLIGLFAMLALFAGAIYYLYKEGGLEYLANFGN